MKNEPALIAGITLLLLVSYLALNAIAPFLFPAYFVYYIAAISVFIVFSRIDFDILRLFAPHLFIGSICLLILTLILGQITRGAVRWIQIGSITIQPTELIRPFIILFFANFLAGQELKVRKALKAMIFLAIPVALILLQPSLGVALMTLVGFGGVILTLKFNKKVLVFLSAIGVAMLPIFWLFLAPYQKIRILALVDPSRDPTGSGYNSIQSKIAVGSGQIFGRGLGEGVQTQLAFLPERHTDFIFASIGEEMGFVGAALVLSLLFFLLWRIIVIVENAMHPVGRAYASGVFLTILAQSIVHIGMNMSLLPITGLPLPIVSAGGSSLIATMIMLGILVRVKKAPSL